MHPAKKWLCFVAAGLFDKVQIDSAKSSSVAACGALEARHLDISSAAKPHSNSSHRILEGIHGIFFDVAGITADYY